MSTTSMTSATPGAATFTWPDGFARIPDEPWTRAEIDSFGLSYDNVGSHGWYSNLEPTIAQVLAALSDQRLLIDFSAGTGILARRLLSRVPYPVGILNVDASPKFLRVAVENVGADERTAFRLLRWRKELQRLQFIDELAEPALLERGADLLTSTNAIHLYSNLAETLASWYRTVRPGGLVFIGSGNMRNPQAPPDNWIIDETVSKVNEIAADLVMREPAFEAYRVNLTDSERLASHTKLREKVFMPVRDVDFYAETFRTQGFDILHIFDSTILARVDEWYELLSTYHEGVLSWVGGAEKVDGHSPSIKELQDRLFLIRYGLEKLFSSGHESFPCTWTYFTCRR